MLNIEERTKLKNQLPKGIRSGYKLIQEKLPHLTTEQIGQAFNYDNRYKQEVMEAALKVIEEYNMKQEAFKQKISAL